MTTDNVRAESIEGPTQLVADGAVVALPGHMLGLDVLKHGSPVPRPVLTHGTPIPRRRRATLTHGNFTPSFIYHI